MIISKDVDIQQDQFPHLVDNMLETTITRISNITHMRKGNITMSSSVCVLYRDRELKDSLGFPTLLHCSVLSLQHKTKTLLYDFIIVSEGKLETVLGLLKVDPCVVIESKQSIPFNDNYGNRYTHIAIPMFSDNNLDFNLFHGNFEVVTAVPDCLRRCGYY